MSEIRDQRDQRRAVRSSGGGSGVLLPAHFGSAIPSIVLLSFPYFLSSALQCLAHRTFLLLVLLRIFRLIHLRAVSLIFEFRAFWLFW